MMMEMISWLVVVYIAVAFVMAIAVLITNYKKLKRLNWWQQILFFVLQPILIIREGIK
ncbi:hypothetical protein [Sulfurimonas sp.]|uniref:hypothetical protein n=1 Tax=Sulfurimonas sp. TaxID=2022749 RepID=UPI0025F1CA61|nr:hypothetical protein [Sulfurimonas sp.]MBW6487502.1 hypothetical protein [Sulfurimonas sp.]